VINGIAGFVVGWNPKVSVLLFVRSGELAFAASAKGLYGQ
jgi:hypothetical protein